MSEQTYLDQLLSWNDKLHGLPAWPLLVISCLAIGYAAKAMPFIPNRWIPFWIFNTGVMGNVLLELGSYNGSRQLVIAAIVRQSLLGAIAGATAWFIHVKFLKKLEQTGDTQFISKDVSKNGDL